MTDETYNGWTNYETWAVNLWLDGNDDGTSEDARKAAKSTRERPENFRDHVEEYIFGDVAPATLGTDLIGSALDRVNWREIVEALTAD